MHCSAPSCLLVSLCRLLGVLALGLQFAAAADLPWNFAVQATATVDPGRSEVTLRWVPPDGALGVTPEHTVFRKRLADLDNPDWGAGTTVPAGQNFFVDAVSTGVAYEYKITRQYAGVNADFNGVGYVRTGIQIPLVDNRGTALVVVENGVAAALSAELEQFVEDLMGDGWRVVRVDGFSASSSPAELQSRLRQENNRGGANVQAVILVGHLPVVYAGTATNPDGHGERPMPADGFYGDMSGDWGPPRIEGSRWIYPRDTFPTALAAAVGRIDFAEMPAIYAVSPFSSEVALLRNYFVKNHAFRTAQRLPQRRALIGDAFGDYYWEGKLEPFSANAYGNFAALFGDRVTVADNFHGSVNAANWLNALADGSYAWAYGGAAGGDSGDSIAALGGDGAGVKSPDLVTRNAKANFYLMFGSYMVDWAQPNNLLRALLAPSDYGLASAWSGRPFLYVHSMGLGETLGYAFRLSANQSGSLYDTPVKVRPNGNTYVRGVYLALLGDPTLRLDPVPMVANLSVDAGSGTASWQPPAGVGVTEYRVYAYNAGGNRYDFVTTLPGSARSYTPATAGKYQVRAVTLQTASGTYFNASQGAAWSTQGATNPPPNPPVQSPISQPGTVQFGIPLLITAPRESIGPRAAPN